MGGFGGIGGGKGNPGTNKELAAMSKELFALSKPLLQQGAGQVQELLSTGGIGATIPSIQQALQASLAAGSQAQRGAEEYLTRQGITGTDAATILTGLSRQSAAEASAIPTSMTMPVLASLYQALFGVPQIAIGGMGQSAAVHGGVRQAEIAGQAQFIKGLQDAATAGMQTSST